jgi:hypothetical protein
MLTLDLCEHVVHHIAHDADPSNLLRLVKQTPHVLWMDNFSKNLCWQIPKLGDGAYKSCMWAGFSLKQFLKQPNLDMKLRYNETTGDVIPAMPDDPFKYKKSFVKMYKSVENEAGMFAFATSKVQLWQVNNVPLKPTMDHAPEKYHEVLKVTESLHNFYPEKLVDLNPAENEHVMRLFKSVLDELLDAEAEGDPAVYKAMTLDMAIYDQCLKVETIFVDKCVT